MVIQGSYSKDSPDIEVVKVIHFYICTIFNFLAFEFLIQNILKSLLALNPRVQHTATLKPSAETKVAKLKWKRNANKSCGVINNKSIIDCGDRYVINN